MRRLRLHLPLHEVLCLGDEVFDGRQDGMVGGLPALVHSHHRLLQRGKPRAEPLALALVRLAQERRKGGEERRRQSHHHSLGQRRGANDIGSNNEP